MLTLSLQIILNGLTTGLVYVLMALGFTLIFGIMRVVNFAHGELYMVGAFAVTVLNGWLSWPYVPAVLCSVILVGLLGSLLERVLFSRVIGNEFNCMILALAVSICLQSLALIAFGPDEIGAPRPVTGVFHLGPSVIPADRLFVGAMATLLLVAFYVFLNKTHLGLMMRAVAQDAEIAALHGIRPKLIHTAAFAIGSLLAGAAGALMAPIYTVFPYMGELPMMKAFIVVVLGGLGSLPGAVIGGLLLGIVESTFATMFGSTVAALVAFAVVVTTIAVRPEGLMGRRA
jgi:branched-chain amino acid transport system permease protein